MHKHIIMIKTIFKNKQIKKKHTNISKVLKDMIEQIFTGRAYIPDHTRQCFGKTRCFAASDIIVSYMM